MWSKRGLEGGKHSDIRVSGFGVRRSIIIPIIFYSASLGLLFPLPPNNLANCSVERLY